MARRNFFRTGDKVTVHDYIARRTSGSYRGRVVCHNRKSRYDMSVVVLIDIGDSEMAESFRQDGKRYIPGGPFITLGWVDEG